MQTRSKALVPTPAQPVAKPTSDEVAGVLGGLEHRWSVNALGVQQRFAEAIDRDDAASAQKWAIAAGISTEKVLLMKGRPTEIVANLHAHRHELGAVMDKLASAARVVSVHQRKGYASVAPSQVTRPLPSPSPTKFVGSPDGHNQ
jgi:hypothetical protein